MWAKLPGRAWAAWLAPWQQEKKKKEKKGLGVYHWKLFFFTLYWQEEYFFTR